MWRRVSYYRDRVPGAGQMRKSSHYVVLFLGLLMVPQVHAGSDLPPGTPPYTRFSPTIKVYPQNFAIAEDRDSIVYMGNYDGVLSFDGELWRLTPLPNHELVRALAYDGHARVYVGGFDEFGYIDHDAAGQPVFHDLVKAFGGAIKKRNFEDIWSIALGSRGVFFVALHDVFMYDPATGRTRTWHYPGRFGAIVNYHGDIVLQFRGRGLERYHAGKWEMLPGGEHFKRLVERFIPLASGGLLALASGGRWAVCQDGRVVPFQVPRGFPASSHFFNGLVLNDRTLVLASNDGSLYFLSADGSRSRRMHLEDGTLSDILRGNDGGLLVVGDQALYHVLWPSAWTQVEEVNGLSGSLSKAVQWHGDWYMLTGAGVFRALRGPSDEPFHYRRLDWTDHEAWDLLPIDDEHALLAESYAVFEIDNGKARAITHDHLYPRDFLRSRFHAGRIYVGDGSGVAALVGSGGRWRLALDDERMKGLNVDTMVEAAPDTLWIGTERGGVRRLRLNADGTAIVGQRAFGKQDGIDYGNGPQGGDVAQLSDGNLIATTAAGEFRWNGSRFVRDGLDGLDRLRKPGEWLTIRTRGDDAWAYSDENVYHRPGKSRPWRKEPIGQIRHGAIQDLALLPDGRAMLVTMDVILRYKPLSYAVHGVAPHVLLRAVELTRADGSHTYLPLHAKAPVQIPEEGSQLTFNFALPDYSGHQSALYSARLKGFEPRYSKWASESTFTYSQLRPADYAFHVRGRDAAGQITSARPFRFAILPRWYASTWGISLWLFLLVLAVLSLAALFVRFRTRKLAAEKERLEAMVTERTAELEAANRQLDTMAHLDGLTGIPNRRRMDDYLEQVWEQCSERRRPLSVLVIDVDRFKDYNDRNGHVAGDLFLKELTATLSHCLRRHEDFLARYGGEEFLVVLPGGDADTALELAEIMRGEVAAREGPTISVGVATAVPTSDLTITRLIREADAALYRAKAQGRNRVVAADAAAR